VVADDGIITIEHQHPHGFYDAERDLSVDGYLVERWEWGAGDFTFWPIRLWRLLFGHGKGRNRDWAVESRAFPFRGRGREQSLASPETTWIAPRRSFSERRLLGGEL
jgi:hypothetical protein